MTLPQALLAELRVPTRGGRGGRWPAALGSPLRSVHSAERSLVRLDNVRLVFLPVSRAGACVRVPAGTAGWPGTPGGEAQLREPGTLGRAEKRRGHCWVLSGCQATYDTQKTLQLVLSVLRTQKQGCRPTSSGPHTPWRPTELQKLTGPPGGFVRGEGAAGLGERSQGPPWDPDTPARQVGPASHLCFTRRGVHGSHSGKIGAVCIQMPTGPGGSEFRSRAVQAVPVPRTIPKPGNQSGTR